MVQEKIARLVENCLTRTRERAPRQHEWPVTAVTRDGLRQMLQHGSTGFKRSTTMAGGKGLGLNGLADVGSSKVGRFGRRRKLDQFVRTLRRVGGSTSGWCAANTRCIGYMRGMFEFLEFWEHVEMEELCAQGGATAAPMSCSHWSPTHSQILGALNSRRGLSEGLS